MKIEKPKPEAPPAEEGTAVPGAGVASGDDAPCAGGLPLWAAV